MDYSEARPTPSLSFKSLAKLRTNTGVVFGVIILSALIAFEMFNYSTTDYALRDLLGDLSFAGIHWATILALAFCGIDFAGIARLFTPEQGAEEPKEVWYLFGAWLLAATMNAILTWWGVSMAIVNHTVQSSAVIDPNTLTRVVPIFVAIMVWVIRILIIGSLSLAGDRLLGSAGRRTAGSRSFGGNRRPATAQHTSLPLGSAPSAPRPTYSRSAAPAGSSEPTYHNLSSGYSSASQEGSARPSLRV
ncbi:MAG: hypothetical protein GYA59_10425 [Chloroflexi bacterium]|nr:hypothetical protein [Chloroflexota bacterium]